MPYGKIIFLDSPQHAVIVSAVLVGLLASAELATEVHLPGEAQDGHVAVVGSPIGVAEGVHGAEDIEKRIIYRLYLTITVRVYPPYSSFVKFS